MAETENRVMPKRAAMDGNTAVAHVAYRLSEVCAIYPITPSSPMAELADEWAASGLRNIWGSVPVIQEMQSEGGAAGAVHGALQSGALTTTFTASQGLLLMLPNMFKIAGELTPTVFHVAARSVATQALSIFGDHSDVMAVRAAGFALLCSASVQEAHDMAAVAHMATLHGRVPVLHFFDGFRTSHELNMLDVLDDEDLRALVDDAAIFQHRARGLNPEHPVVRGTAHNPDTFFQARETVNPFYAAMVGHVEQAMARLAARCGRNYGLVQYDGDADATRVVVVMGSAAETLRGTAEVLRAGGEKIGVLQIRLMRPFPRKAFLAALPATARAIAVLERTKEPGAAGEPLYQDVTATLAEAYSTGIIAAMPRISGGRFGLSSKDFSPAMAKAVFDELAQKLPRNGFTVGIVDDVAKTSLPFDVGFSIEDAEDLRAVFYGLGSDGTVGANKNSVKILAEDGEHFAQGYFVYDSHKSGAETISHLRISRYPIRAPYLISRANFIACHHWGAVARHDLLRLAEPGATLLLNSPHAANRVWEYLPRAMQGRILALGLHVFVVDASKAAEELGLGRRINTILQTCFFAISKVMPREQAIARIKAAIGKTYAGKGEDIVARNFAAVDGALARLAEMPVPRGVTARFERAPIVPEDAPEFIRTVTALMLDGRGDEIPVSQMPPDGTFPPGTAVFEKRDVAEVVPIWYEKTCVQCGQCSFVCPHGVIRAKYYDKSLLSAAPAGFRTAPINVRGFPHIAFTLQFYLEDCTGCGLCVEACPAISVEDPAKKAINLNPKGDLAHAERTSIAFFENLPINDRAFVDFATVRGVQFLEPLFAFSGACAGCGETPYLKLLSQIFGDRMMVANATGCSSIYGGNLPVTPWSKNAEGRGPAWSNSLFEDNAEFGLGFRLAADQHLELARRRLRELAPRLGEALVAETLAAPQRQESEIRAQRARVARLGERLAELGEEPAARDLVSVLDHLVRRSVWIVGGDGWAYDIGYGGLDHVLASGRDVNVLVLDTEVYSNTGGQASKATPLGAIARFAAAGKRTARKDLALQAIAYGNVYVAQVAMGANPQQTLLAFREAEAYPGPSLIIAYAHCIAHGYDLRQGLHQQDLAAASGYWPLFRYNPAMREVGERPFRLDSPRPTIAFRDYAYNELRYRQLASERPEEAEQLVQAAQAMVAEKYRAYEEMAGWHAGRFHPPVPDVAPGLGTLAGGEERDEHPINTHF